LSSLTRRKSLKVDPRLEESLINAAILAGLAFFSTLGGNAAVGLLAEPKAGLLAAAIAAGIAFFARLAIERGLK